MPDRADSQVDEPTIDGLMESLGFVVCLPYRDTKEWCREKGNGQREEEVVIVPRSCPRRDLREILRANGLPVPDWLREDQDD